MNCELAHERIVMAAYGELADDAAHELERHLATCVACGQEREQVWAIKLLADAYPVEELPANLVARSRMRLEEALDALPPKRWFERVAQRFVNSFARLQSAPLAAALLLLAGLGGGAYGGYHYAGMRAARTVTAQNVVPGVAKDDAAGVEVTNISTVEQQASSPQQVEVNYNELVPHKVKGSIHDPAIRKLLMVASENSASAGVRDDSVGLLADACRASNGCQSDGIREALLVALRYDRNAAVRQRALEGLQPYVSEDLGVRDAILEALMNDSDPRIRTEAINILQPVEADTSVRQVLHTVANSDRNPQIRLVSRQVLSRVPEIQ